LTITLDQYFGGRRESHPTECSPGIEANAMRSVPIFNAMIAEAERFGIVILINPSGDFAGSQINSGWRPPSINACTPGASATSLHMTGEAVDLHDPAGELDAWLLTPEGQYTLVDLGLWLENPGSTPGWSHVQTRPPKSGRRVFSVAA
jgi:hypothetical protein